MKQQTKQAQLIKISSVKIDEKLYPRTSVDWTTSAKYYNALKSGANFPPILVAKKGFKYVLIDGGHRLKAHKDFGETHIQAEVVKGWTDEQIYTEAVRLNSQHGRNFSTQEITKIILTLQEWNKSKKEISALVSIPVKELDTFVAKRISPLTSGSGMEALKSPLKHLAGIPQNDNEIDEQGVLASRGQIQLLENVLTMLEHDWFNLQSAMVRAKLKKIYKALTPLFIKDKKED